MKLVVGLGNPGSKYALTRHNAGFMAVDRLAERLDTPVDRNFYAPWWDKEFGRGRKLYWPSPRHI